MERREFIKKAAIAAAGAAVVSPVSAMINADSDKKCKVLMINGSPRPDGNTFCCLKEIESVLLKHGIESEIAETRHLIRDSPDRQGSRPHVYQLRRMPSEWRQGLRVRR